MEAANHGVDLLQAGEFLGVAHDIDDAGVAAASKDDQPLIADVEQQCLVIQDERIRLPFPIVQGLMPR